MSQKQRVIDLRDKDRVDSVFLVLRKSVPLTKAGKPYLALTLGDRTGEIEARGFDRVEAIDPLFAQGDYLRVEGTASPYGGRLQIKVDAASRVPASDIPAGEFLPSTRFDVDDLFAQVRGLVVQVRDDHIRTLLLGFLDDPELGPAFRRAPAAKTIHHPFLGGLCEHTLSVLQLGWRICDHYPSLDRDLVTAGCLLHDIGKARELTYETSFGYSEEGQLVGHLVMTCQWIHERAARIPGFPRELVWHLSHLVAAHHGELEYGSPKQPMTLEAMVVHALDELDSKVNAFSLLFARDRSSGAFTDYQRLYERPLFKGPSWNREPLPPDARRFQGPGVYEQARPEAHEDREPASFATFPADRESSAAAAPHEVPRPAPSPRIEPQLPGLELPPRPATLSLFGEN